MYTFLFNVKISLTAFSSRLAAKVRKINVSCAVLRKQLHLLKLRYIIERILDSQMFCRIAHILSLNHNGIGPMKS